MRLEHFAEIHAIQLIAREDQNVVDPRLLQITQVLPYGVGSTLIPIGVFGCLLSGQNLDKPAAEDVERVRAANVPVQADRIELSQDIQPIQAAIDAIGKR